MLTSALRTTTVAGLICLLMPLPGLAQDSAPAAPVDPHAFRAVNETPPHERVGVFRIAEPKPAEAAKRPKAPERSLATRILRRDFSYGDWVAAQIFFVIFGLLAALIALALAPKTTTLAVAAIDTEPARAAVVGFLGLALLGIVSTVNRALFGTIVWIPFGTMVELASTVTILFSGLLGIAYFGGVLQKRRRPGVRGFFSRAALGLIAIALFNCIPGVNAASLFLQLIAFILGLGGLIITGFGRDPDWLSKRLNAAGREWRD